MYNIIYFEDDAQLAAMITDFFKSKLYSSTHFSSFKAFTDSGLNVAENTPDAVLLDINLPDVDGYQICEHLIQNGLPEDVPVIFVSGLMNSDDIVNAYKVGGHDYLVKPVKLSELEVKLTQNIESMQARKALKAELSNSHSVALKVMTSMSELGSILRFHDECMSVTSEDEIIDKLFELVSGFGLNSSILLHTDKAIYRASSGQGSKLEYQTLELLASKSRIYSWSNRTCFNYPHFSLLITNMPINDDMRYGELKDLLCLLLNGLNARFEGLLMTRREQQKSLLLADTINKLCELVDNMSDTNKVLVKEFETVIEQVEHNITGDIIQFNLLEDEEKSLIQHINKCLKQAQTIFDKSIQSEAVYKQQVEDLTDVIIAAR